MRGLCRLHTCTMSLYVKKKKNWDHLQSFTSVGFWSQPSEVGYWAENSWAGHSLKCTQAHNTQYITEGASFTHHSEIWMSIQPGSFSFSHSHWPKFYPSSGKRWFLLPEEVIWIARSSIGGVWPVHIWCGFKIVIYGGGLTFFPHPFVSIITNTQRSFPPTGHAGLGNK